MDINFSRYPATVTADGAKIARNCAVAAGGHTVELVTRALDVLFVRDDLVELAAGRGGVRLLHFADGAIWTVSAGTGCGCGNNTQTWAADRARELLARMLAPAGSPA